MAGHVAYNIRIRHANKSNVNYDVNWSKLDEWGRQFVENNPGSRFHLETDSKGRFKRMFVGIGCSVQTALKTGINFSGIDGTAFHHIFFRKGVALILDTRDGNNQILILAFIVCLHENSDNYDYFARQCVTVPGLMEYLNRVKSILYSDRHKGIPAFEAHVSSFIGNCIVHIIKNCHSWVGKHFRGANNNFAADRIHKIQTQTTREGFEEALQEFSRAYPEAATYLRNNVDHSKTYVYAMLQLGLTTHGHHTSNIVEIANMVIKKARKQDPYNFLDWFLLWIAGKIGERQRIGKKLEQDGRLLTEYAMKILVKQETLAAYENLEKVELGNDKYQVIHNTNK